MGGPLVSVCFCLFEGDPDVARSEYGPYATHNALRAYVVRELEAGQAGSRFPMFMFHADCDEASSVADCENLRDELAAIAAAMKLRPAVRSAPGGPRAAVGSIGLVPQNAFESFVDAEGEILLERLQSQVDDLLKRRLPIVFNNVRLARAS